MRTSWRIDWINWPLSQRTAQANARRAAAVCRQRRWERQEVEDYLAGREPARR
ncbi:MAG: hypothetical protein ACTHOK_01425 [Nocardioidaceae bacterium]